MDRHIKRFHLAAQALVYTGLLSIALESGTASAQWQSSSLPSSAPQSTTQLAKTAQQPDWLLPLGGVSLLAISFGIEVYRHRCFLGAATEENTAQELAQSAQRQAGTNIETSSADGQTSYSAQPLREC